MSQDDDAIYTRYQRYMAKAESFYQQAQDLQTEADQRERQLEQLKAENLSLNKADLTRESSVIDDLRRRAANRTNDAKREQGLAFGENEISLEEARERWTENELKRQRDQGHER